MQSKFYFTARSLYMFRVPSTPIPSVVQGQCFEICQFLTELFEFTIPNRSTALKTLNKTQKSLFRVLLEPMHKPWCVGNLYSYARNLAYLKPNNDIFIFRTSCGRHLFWLACSCFSIPIHTAITLPYFFCLFKMFHITKNIRWQRKKVSKFSIY